jgi:hypothetical protein
MIGNKYQLEKFFQRQNSNTFAVFQLATRDSRHYLFLPLVMRFELFADVAVPAPFLGLLAV